jgi:NADH-quinone oxidoreductase subunit J
MNISPFFFYLFAGSALMFSLFVILKRNPVASAFSLVMVFFSFAGLYAIMDAHLIAAMQILVYAGAIMVLFVFVIMLLNADTPSFDLERSTPLQKTAIASGASLALLVLMWVFKHGSTKPMLGAFSPERIEKAGGNVRVISELMFSEYILPFELTSALLLAAIVGAVAIAKRKQDHDKMQRSPDAN